jgi:hypothetical protein
MLDEFISQHCAVFRRGGLDESDLRLKGITNAPNYSTQSFWLARIYALGRIPRKDLEQALEGTLSFGFTPKCNTRCRGHKRYDYETWTTAKRLEGDDGVGAVKTDRVFAADKAIQKRDMSEHDGETRRTKKKR